MDETLETQGTMDRAIQVIVHAGNMEDSVALRVHESSGETTDMRGETHHEGLDIIRVIVTQDVEGGLVEQCDPQSSTSAQAGSSDAVSNASFDVPLSERFGYVYSLAQAEKIRRKFEMDTKTSYVAVSNTKFNFGQTEFGDRNHRIYWEEPLQETPSKSSSRMQFDGVPFILLAKRVLDCQHGRDWHKHNREKKSEKVERKRRKKQPHRSQETRKLGCLANITMREVICYTDFKIDENSEYKRKSASKRLRAALKEGAVEGQKRIYVDLPEVTTHNHPINENIRVTHQTLDEHVLEKLQELVNQGILDIEEIRQQLRIYVETNIESSPPLTNRRFYPSKSTIRSHIRRCCLQQTHMRKEEQEVTEFNNRQKQAGEVGKSFCETYYKTFDTSREQLAPLYHPTHSVMSFEGVPYFGSVDITNHLKGLPFVTAIHAMTSIDCHFTVDNSILVAVLGQIQVDNDPKKSFHQTFMLKQDGNSLFIVNDIFRLGVHNF